MEYMENRQLEGQGERFGEDWGQQYIRRPEEMEQPSGIQSQGGTKYNLRSLRNCFRTVGLAYVVYLVVSTASQLMVSLFLKVPESNTGWNLWMMVCMLSMYPLSTLFLYLILRRLPKARQTWKEPMTMGRYIGIFAVCMGFLYLGNFLGQAVAAILKMITGMLLENDLDTLINDMQPWLILLVVVIVGPVMEELVFRKMLLDRIAGYGQLTSMLISGLIFGIAHANFYQFFYAFALGSIFAWVYLRTGNIFHTIGLHMIINLCGSFLPLYLVKLMESWGPTGLLLLFCQMMVMFAFIIAAIILLIYYRKEIFLYEERKKISAGKWCVAVTLNIGMILYFLIGGFMFLLNF